MRVQVGKKKKVSETTLPAPKYEMTKYKGEKECKPIRGDASSPTHDISSQDA